MQTKTNVLIIIGVVLCFILSGFAALLYQTAWMRQFSLVFGTSELAVAAVLSAYMGGLAFGAAVAAKFVDRITRPVLFYGLLEAGIALSALAVPLLLKLASVFYVAALGGQSEPVDASGLGQSFFYLGVAFVVLAIPTSFMGATLPLLTKYVVRSREQISSRVGMLYASNTAGAIAGTVCAGFILLPLLGLNGTVWVGVAINVLVFGLAAIIAMKVGKADGRDVDENLNLTIETAPGRPVEPQSNWRLWILPIMLLSGANSFIYEVLWTRLLGHILGGSIMAFSTMLAGFLGGIAIGSAVAALLAKTRQTAITWFVIVQCGIAAASALIYQYLPLVIPEQTGLGGNIAMAIGVLLPATIFIGATFPLAVRILARDEGDAAPASARVYSWNTVGAIIGASAAAFFLIPLLKYEGAVRFAVVLNLGLAAASALLLVRGRWIVAGFSGALMAIAVVLYQPTMPEEILRASPVFSEPDGDIRFYEVGRSATVLVIEKDGFLNIRTNGLPEASSSLKGAPPSLHTQKMLSIMPVLARPDTETMMVIGLGGGVALEGVPRSVKEVDAVELEPQVVAANRFFGDERDVDPLQDPRINLVINDARSALTLSEKRYDAIVSQPSHPWTAGASHLYTREFMELAKSRLTEDGVYLQWMNTQFVDEDLLKSLAATMTDVYPHVRAYQWQTEVIFFLGSDAPLEIEAQTALTGRPLSDDPLSYLESGVGSVEDIVAALIMDQRNVDRFSEGAPLITDNYNLMATRSSRAMDKGTVLRGGTLLAFLADFDPLRQQGSDIRTSFPIDLNYPYLSMRLQGMGMTRRAIDLANSLVDAGDPQSLVMIGMGQQGQGNRGESERNLLRALEADPNDVQARFALVQPWLPSFVAGGELPAPIKAELDKLGGSALATIIGGQAMHANDFGAISQLDRALAEANLTDLWFASAVKLRVEWRIRVTSTEYRARFANEALQLIDSAIAFHKDPEFFSLRIRAAMAAERYDVAVETSRRMILVIEGLIDGYDRSSFPADQGAVQRYLQQVRVIRTVLENEGVRSSVPRYKQELLSESIEELSEKLEGLLR